MTGWALAWLAPSSLAWGLWLAQRELCRASCALVSPGDGGPWRVLGGANDGPLHQVRWRLRGPIAVLSARDAQGRRCHFVWGPDTLAPSARRQLKLAGVVSSRYDKPLPPVAA